MRNFPFEIFNLYEFLKQKRSKWSNITSTCMFWYYQVCFVLKFLNYGKAIKMHSIKIWNKANSISECVYTCIYHKGITSLYLFHVDFQKSILWLNLIDIQILGRGRGLLQIIHRHRQFRLLFQRGFPPKPHLQR